MKDWQSMAQEMNETRPAVISDSSYKRLNELRGFRHVVRNVYTYNFDPMKMGKITEGAPDLSLQVSTELLAFADFLEKTE